MEKEIICVTGASGFIASWIVRMLLEYGYTVHATIRDVNSPACAHVLTKEALGLPSAAPGTLQIFSGCDLLIPGSFDEAMKGCDICIHTASPFIMDQPKDAQKDLIEPALKGTENVLNSVNKSKTVKRVVLTSSIAAIATPLERKPHNAPFNEEDWNTYATLETEPYPLSKKVAEQRAWEMEKAQSVWKMVTIHPGLVMGPVLSSRSNDGSISFIKKFLSGSMTITPHVGLAFVDVRDVAHAHILGMKSEKTGRYICVENSYYYADVANMLRPKYGQKFSLPKFTLPDGLAKTFLPMGHEYSRQYLDTNLNSLPLYSNLKIKQDFGMTFTPFEKTIDDMVDSLVERKVVG